MALGINPRVRMFVCSRMPPLSQEQKHQALVQLRSNVYTHKVATFVDMGQSFVR